MDITLKIDDQMWADLALHHAEHRESCKDLGCPLRNAQSPEEYVAYITEEYIRGEHVRWSAIRAAKQVDPAHPVTGNGVVGVASFEEFMRMLFGPGSASGGQGKDKGDHSE